MTKVFLSYAHQDSSDLVLRLGRDLTMEGFEAWIDMDRLYGGATWTKGIETAIDEAEVVLALLSPGAYASEICRAEQLRALRKDKCVIPLLVQPKCDIPLHLEPRQYIDFTPTSSYQDQFRKLLRDIGSRKGVALSPEYRITYNNTPGLFENLVRRPEVIQALRNRLFAEGANRNIALTALQGMGGIGKTVLAQELCHDEAVQQAFPDGIFWFTIGKEIGADFVSKVRGVPGLDRLLGDYAGERACVSQYRDVFRKKAALIVLDDVWHAADVKPFYAESPRSRLLITTRDGSIAPSFGARSFRAELLTDEQSLELLTKWSGWKNGPPPQAAEDIVRECGRLPLALSMIGASLHGEPRASWNSVLGRLREADLGMIRGAVADYPHASFLRALQVSIEALEKDETERYLELAVLLEDLPIPISILRTLWNLDDFDARRAAKRFVDLSLAQRHGNDGAIRLHDLQLDYVRARSPLREALPLIQGAMRLSAHVVSKDPNQFASQTLGRLLPHIESPGVRSWLESLADGAQRPFLRPLWVALTPPGQALVRTLTGHFDAVTALAIHSHRKWALSASSNGTLKIWNMDTGAELRSWNGHASGVTAIALYERSRAVSACWDGTLKVWDLETEKELRTLRGHALRVTAVAVDEDAKRALSASWDGTLRLWDLETGTALRVLPAHANGVSAVALYADGTRAVSSSGDGTLKVWDLETATELRTLSGHANGVTAVAVHPSGSWAISASDDETLKLWDLQEGTELRTLVGHTFGVTAIAVLSDGKRAISASRDNTLKIWDLESATEVLTLHGHTKEVNAVAVYGNDKRAISGSGDHTLKVWDLETKANLRPPGGHPTAVNALALYAEGMRGVSASKDGTLKVWDLKTKTQLGTLRGHTDEVTAVAVHPEGRRAISASWDHTLKIWDLETGAVLRTLTGHTGGVVAVTMTAAATHVVSASWDNTLKMWDLETGVALRTLCGHRHAVTAVAVHPDGRRLISASRDQTVKVWDLGTGTILRSSIWGAEPINALAVYAEGTRVISASSDGTLRVWDLERWLELRTMNVHKRELNAVAVHAEGRWAFSASNDNTLRMWDLNDGEVIATFTTEASLLTCSVNADIVAAGDQLGQLHFLQIVTTSTASLHVI